MPSPLHANLLAYCRGILSDRGLRRRWLWWLTSALLAAFFIGAVPGANWADSIPLFFLFYWLGVCWLLLAVALLALYDLLSVWAEGRRAKRMLEKHLDARAKRIGGEGRGRGR